MSRPPRDSRVAPTALDVAAFCRDGERLEGHLDLAQLPRLAECVWPSAGGAARAERSDLSDLSDRPGASDGADAPPVQWRAEGSRQPVAGGSPHCLIDLSARAALRLQCQRCLQPVSMPIEVERRFRFVPGEEAAARLDEELDDDVLALAPRFDLLGLVEDELLLALPLVPRHDECPELPAALRPQGGAPAASGAAAGRAEEVEPPSADRPDGSNRPFAVLAALRRPKS